VKRLLIILFIFFQVKSFASGWIFDADSTYHNSVDLSSGYFFGSNAITNQFALAYFRGEFIDEAKKNIVTGNLSDNNRFGVESMVQLKYNSKNRKVFGLPNSFFSIALNTRYHINSKFRYDAFEIYFRGNEDYRNKTADLGNFAYNQVFYQQFNFTFGHEYKRNENKLGYAFGLNYNNGQKLFEIKSEHATVFTEKDGRYLDLNASVDIHQSDSSRDELSSINGAGTSADIYFYRTSKNNNTLKFSATNFGFIKWNDQTAHISADTSFRFEGIDVSNLFLLSDSVKETISIDSSLVEPYLSAREKKSYMYALPANLFLSYQYRLAHGMRIEGGLEYLCFAGSTLREMLTFSYEFSPQNSVSLITSHGGYTGFNAGLAFSTFFLHRWRFTAQSDYLTGMIDYSKGNAQGAFISITAYF
jgi:hypothetical protein